MNSHAQVFFSRCPTLRTLLRSSPCVNYAEKLAPLPTHIFNQGAELSKSPIQHVLAKHPFSRDSIVKVFHEDHVSTITQSMCLFEVEVFASVINRVVHLGNFDTLFLVVLRPFLFSTQPALRGNKAGGTATPLFALAISACFASA